MTNPFKDLIKDASVSMYDEWGGQFSCQEHSCYGYATVARYFKKSKRLEWTCQDQHVSYLENVNE